MGCSTKGGAATPDPPAHYLTAVKRILRYLKRAKNLNSSIEIARGSQVFVDSGWANENGRKSRSCIYRSPIGCRLTTAVGIDGKAERHALEKVPLKISLPRCTTRTPPEGEIFDGYVNRLKRMGERVRRLKALITATTKSQTSALS